MPLFDQDPRQLAELHERLFHSTCIIDERTMWLSKLLPVRNSQLATGVAGGS